MELVYTYHSLLLGAWGPLLHISLLVSTYPVSTGYTSIYSSVIADLDEKVIHYSPSGSQRPRFENNSATGNLSKHPFCHDGDPPQTSKQPANASYHGFRCNFCFCNRFIGFPFDFRG